MISLSIEKQFFLVELWGSNFKSRHASMGLTVKLAIAHIDSHYQNNISREIIAIYLKINPDYLSRLFQKECDICLIAYITAYRMYHARKYLSDHPRMKIKDISASIGIADAGYFCRLFKKYNGLTPNEFRIKGLTADC